MRKKGNISDCSQKKTFQNQYKAWKVLDVAGYVNPEEEKIAKDLIEEVALFNGFTPSYFATMILTEAFGIHYINYPGNYETISPYTLRNDFSVSGFDTAGTDDFGSEYKRNKTASAIFSSMESAFYGVGATLSYRRDLFLKAAKDLGYPAPTEDEKAYWTYIYCQGEGQAYRWLEEAGSLDIFYRTSLHSSGLFVRAAMREANDMALSNLASWRYLKTANIFSN